MDVADEQMQRFDELKSLAAEAKSSVEQICELTANGLDEVAFDDPAQGSQLQRLQQCAGKAVAILEELNVAAKHARAWGAQRHIERDK